MSEVESKGIDVSPLAVRDDKNLQVYKCMSLIHHSELILPHI